DRKRLAAGSAAVPLRSLGSLPVAIVELRVILDRLAVVRAALVPTGRARAWHQVAGYSSDLLRDREIRFQSEIFATIVAAKIQVGDAVAITRPRVAWQWQPGVLNR